MAQLVKSALRWDFDVYLRQLAIYRRLAVRETPAAYRADLDRWLRDMERLLPQVESGDPFALTAATILGTEMGARLLAHFQVHEQPRTSPADAFRLLCSRGLLPAEDVPNLVRLVRARNRCAHMRHLPTPAAARATAVLALPGLRLLVDRVSRWAASS